MYTGSGGCRRRAGAEFGDGTPAGGGDQGVGGRERRNREHGVLLGSADRGGAVHPSVDRFGGRGRPGTGRRTPSPARPLPVHVHPGFRHSAGLAEVDHCTGPGQHRSDGMRGRRSLWCNRGRPGRGVARATEKPAAGSRKGTGLKTGFYYFNVLARAPWANGGGRHSARVHPSGGVAPEADDMKQAARGRLRAVTVGTQTCSVRHGPVRVAGNPVREHGATDRISDVTWKTCPCKNRFLESQSMRGRLWWAAARPPDTGTRAGRGVADGMTRVGAEAAGRVLAGTARGAAPASQSGVRCGCAAGAWQMRVPRGARRTRRGRRATAQAELAGAGDRSRATGTTRAGGIARTTRGAMRDGHSACHLTRG